MVLEGIIVRWCLGENNPQEMKINLIVLKTNDPESLKKQYELLGLTFEYHNHGNGPFHFSAEVEGLVFEIYPLSNQIQTADNTLRLGFEIKKLEAIITQLQNTSWIVSSHPKLTNRGRVAILQDLDGRKIELKESIKN